MGVIRFDGHEVVAVSEVDFAGDFLLAAHRVEAEGMAFKGEEIEKVGDGGDFVGFGVDFELGKAEALLGGVGAEEVALLSGAVEAVTHCFAVNGDELGGEFATQAFGEVDEAGIEGLGVDGAEHASESVVAGHSEGEFEEFLEPGLLGFGEARHVVKALALANDGGGGDEEDFAKVVPFVASGARVGQIAEGRNRIWESSGVAF